MAFRLNWKQGQKEQIHEADPNCVDFINSKIECADFDNHASKTIIQNAIKQGFPQVEWLEQFRMFAFVSVGVLTGAIASLIIFCYENGAHFKYHLLIDQFNKRWNTPESFPALSSILLAFMIVPALVGSALCIYIEPKAAGGGLAPVIAYVNGVKVPGALACKTLIVKTFSLICCMLAGLAAGMEAPMVHVGACVACSMVNMKIPFTKIHPFRNLHTDVDRRDLVGAGMAAGIVGAFSTPIGGCLLALEEGITFYNVRLLLRILVASVSCCFTVNLLLSFASECLGCLSQNHLLFFFVVKENSNLQYYAYQFPFYALTGMIGGVLGAAFNLIQIRLIIFRKRFVKKKWQQLLEVIVIVLLTFSFYALMLFAFDGTCSPKIEKSYFDSVNHAKLGCKNESEVASPSLFVFQTVPNIIRMMYSESLVSVDKYVLLVFLCGLYFLTVYTMGAIIASGIFVPHLAIGATWGRLFGKILRETTGWDWVQPNIYAFIASGAQLTGCVRIPFTIGVLMMEATGSTIMGAPIFIAVISSYLVASLFTESIYHHQWSMAGLPCVSTDPPPFCSRLTAQELMNEPPVTLTKRVSVATVRNTLKSTTHNCFPVITSSGILEGSISRGLLIILIKNEKFIGSTASEEDSKILWMESLSVQNVNVSK